MLLVPSAHPPYRSKVIRPVRRRTPRHFRLLSSLSPRGRTCRRRAYDLKCTLSQPPALVRGDRKPCRACPLGRSRKFASCPLPRSAITRRPACFQSRSGPAVTGGPAPTLLPHRPFSTLPLRPPSPSPNP